MAENTNLIMNQFVFAYFACCPVQAFGGASNWKIATTPDPAYSLISTNFHTGIIDSSNQLFMSGYGSGGRLGDNTIISKSSPVQTISGGSNWKNISTTNHTVATKTDGTLWSWGFGLNGRLGNSSIVDRSSPVQTISAGTNWKQAIAGIYGSIATKTDGSLWNWGSGSNGRLGNNNTVISHSSPVQTVSNVTTWKVGVVQSQHSASLKTDGTLWNWGRNFQGRLGNDATPSQSSPIQTISGGTDWSQVSTTSSGTLGLKTDGTLWSWGINFRSELGIGFVNSPRSSPVQTISGGTNWKFGVGGYYKEAGIKTDGTLWIWGENTIPANMGVSVIGATQVVSPIVSPTQTVLGGTNWCEITLAKRETRVGGGWIALKSDGTAWGSGYVGNGEKGNNNISYLALEEKDLGEIFVWKDCFTNNGLWLAGCNPQGQLGNNSVITNSSPIQTISGGSNWKVISASSSIVSAIKTDGTLWMWGGASFGALGNNTSVGDRSSPIQTIAGGSNWSKVNTGTYHTIATKTDGTLWAWGYGNFGRLGNNASIRQSSPVQTVSATSNWKNVAAGCEHSVATKTDGTLWTWGRSVTGELGNCSTISQSSPVQTVSATSNWSSVGAGDLLSASIKTDGTLWVWGSNVRAALGDLTNTGTNVCSPIQTVAGGTNWKSIGVTCFGITSVKTDGTLWLWGDGRFGSIGDNTTTLKSSPVQTVSGGTNWKVGYGGYVNRAGIKTDGTLWVWGLGAALGANTSVNASSPVQTITGGVGWRNVVVSGRPFIMAIREDCW